MPLMSLSDRSCRGTASRAPRGQADTARGTLCRACSRRARRWRSRVRQPHVAHLGAVEVGVPRDATLYEESSRNASVNEMPTSLQSVSFVRCIVPLIICVLDRSHCSSMQSIHAARSASSRKVGSRQTCNRGMSTRIRAALQRKVLKEDGIDIRLLCRCLGQHRL